MYTAKDLSLVIPSHNEEHAIDSCMLSILRQTMLPGEIIFVDNNSADHTVQHIEKMRDKFNIPTKLYIEKSIGIPFARNRGIIESSGKIITFLDSDCEAPKYYIEKILADFNSQNVDAVTGKYELDGTNNIKAVYRGRVWSHHFGWNTRNTGKDIVTSMSSQIGTIVSGCSAFKKDVLEKLGLFDTQFIYMDDIALSKKFYKMGFKTLRDMDIKVIHHINTDERIIMRKDIHYGYDDALINKFIDNKRVVVGLIDYKRIFGNVIKLISKRDAFYFYEIRTIIYHKIGFFIKGISIGCLFI